VFPKKTISHKISAFFKHTGTSLGKDGLLLITCIRAALGVLVTANYVQSQNRKGKPFNATELTKWIS